MFPKILLVGSINIHTPAPTCHFNTIIACIILTTKIQQSHKNSIEKHLETMSHH